MTDDYISRIEAALAAGPTPGPWHHREWGSRIVDSGVGSSQLLIAQVAVHTFRDQGRHNANFIAACNPVAICTLLDRLRAAEAEVGRLKCNAPQWRKPGPVTAEHPLDCLIVVPALRQADGDWWLEGSKFLSDNTPIAWCADTSIARSALEDDHAR